MRKTTKLLGGILLAFLAAFSLNLSAVTVTIGTGTNSSNYPFTTFWMDGRTQMMYTAAEITANGGVAGNITSIAFNVISNSTQVMNSFTVRMQNTTATSIPAFVETGWTTVLTTNWAVPGTGWQTINLATPFAWDGTSNLMVEICYDNNSYTSYSPVYSTAAAGMTWGRYQDLSTASGCTITGGAAQANRPNIRLEMTPAYTGVAIVEGVVTNEVTGAPIVGAFVKIGDSTTYTIVGGTYSLHVPPTTLNVLVKKSGYDDYTTTVTGVANTTTTLNVAMQENTPAPGVVFASLNTAQTAVTITWGLPQSSYEIVYDDGVFENMTAWAVGGNINALKFTPINSYPLQVTGGKVNIGDGSYPSGANLQSFTMAVYKDDGPLGYPGTELATVDVTPTHYGWVEFTFPTPVTITSGNFYLGMIQGGNYPNCVPIAIDETNPSMRSYSRFVTGNAPWVLAGYNDFMIRATVYGAGGPLDLTANTNAPRFIEKQRISAASRFMNQPKIVSGYEGDALYIPAGDGDAPESLLGYQVWRLKQGEENIPANWVSVGTPTTTSIVDNSWPSLTNGAYRWAVKAKYSNNRWSDAVFSNVLGKGWTSNVTFNITLSSQGALPEGVSIQMQNTAPYADSSYYALTGPSGTVNFPHVWKGNYNITVQKFGYDIYASNVDILNDSYTFNIMLMETRWAPTNLYVDDRTLLATWNAPVVEVALLEERWTSGSFNTNQWVRAGGNNWVMSTTIGNPAPSAMFNWSPQVTNYEQTLTSKSLQGVGSPVLKLKYDIYLDNFGTTNENQMAVEIWDGAAWNRLKNYTNLNGSIPWTSESIDISAYTWDTFKIRFVAYGADSYDINNWNVDNILVVASLADKNLLGYGVYLDNVQIGFTTETQYQIPHNLCTYGQTYTASVDANYESGVSDRDYYTFVAHYLPAPRNLAATAVQDAAYLTWEHPVMGSKVNILDQSPRTNMPDPNVEYSPMVTVQEVTNATEAIWDVLFTFNAADASRPGVETDGTYIYTSQWNGPNFGKFQNQGGTWTLVNEFTVAGASNIRDLAYDGTYFYGGSASTTIYKMDFNTQTLVGTISTSGVNVRHISYDPANNGFWTGNWSDMYLVSNTGATLQTANTGLSAMYGNAYDNVSAGGPYVWIFDQNGSGVDIQQMSVATGTLTGVVHAATDLPGFQAGSIAGGLASDNGNLVSGKFILLANVQQTPNLVGAYEVAASTGGGGGGAAPAALMGYNIYRDGNFIAYVEKPTQEYYDLYLNPGQYCYSVTAVYDLTAYGFPAGSTAESLEEGPACVTINYGVPIPWTEDWATANFTYNNWSFAPAQGHWRISNMTGNAIPSAEFTWAAPETNYSYALVSPALNASVFNCAEIYLDFDLKLDDRNQTAAEKLTVDVYWDGQWHKVAEYKNEGSFNWSTKHITINQTAGKALKVRFVANGSNSADILGWFVDNITVYPVVMPATNLTGETQNFNATLNWNAPECQTGPAGTLKMLKQWDGDPNVNPNAYFQQFNYAYGVVYDLTAYPDATLSKIDFHHASWGTFGTWQYKIHIVDWNTFTEVATLGPLTTTGNDIWESNISLGDLMGYGGGLVGIVLEPMSNQPTDAYPCFTADNDGPQGASVFGPLPNYGGFAPSQVGDFYQNLYIYTAFDGGKMVAAPKVVLNGLNTNALARGPVVPNLRPVLTANQQSINVPTEGAKGVVGYNIYRNGEKINNALVTNTTYTDNVGVNGTYCYVVKAVHEAFVGTMESAASNEVCLSFTVGIENPSHTSISVYPNPARTFVNIQVGNDVKSLEMVNYLGQKVYSQALQGAGKYTLNTNNLESGVYFIRLTTTDGSIITERVTITK